MRFLIDKDRRKYMKHRTISLVTVVVSVCCIQSYLQAIERKNIFKVAAATLVGVVACKIATDKDPVATLQSASHAFSDGALTCFFATGGSRVGGYVGDYIAPANAANVYAGILGGGMLGDKIGYMITGTSIRDIIIDNPNRRSKLERISESVGCFCGSSAGLAATQAVFE
jgi:hypothetical protein